VYLEKEKKKKKKKNNNNNNNNNNKKKKKKKKKRERARERESCRPRFHLENGHRLCVPICMMVVCVRVHACLSLSSLLSLSLSGASMCVRVHMITIIITTQNTIQLLHNTSYRNRHEKGGSGFLSPSTVADRAPVRRPRPT
jgi:hypothetical protein